MARQARNAGGAAANAGPEYQHRIGAFICALMVARVELSFLVGSDQKLGVPTRISYESLNPIDDINVVTDKGTKVYIQAKRSIKKSVLRAVLAQFARQYKSERPSPSTIYSLITSSRPSSVLSRDAKRVLEVLRLAPSGDFSPSHNESLQDIYVFLVDAGTRALREAGLPHEDEYVRDFLQFVFIDVVDIEKNEQMEKAVLCSATALMAGQRQLDGRSLRAAKMAWLTPSDKQRCRRRSIFCREKRAARCRAELRLVGCPSD